MADLNISAESVVAGSNASKLHGFLGNSVSAGQVLYKSATTSLWLLADANGATEVIRRAIGIALNGGAVNQPVVIQTAGDITFGTIMDAGTSYYLSSDPGGICPLADVGAGEYVVHLGIAKSATLFAIDIAYPGVAL